MWLVIGCVCVVVVKFILMCGDVVVVLLVCRWKGVVVKGVVVSVRSR